MACAEMTVDIVQAMSGLPLGCSSLPVAGRQGHIACCGADGAYICGMSDCWVVQLGDIGSDRTSEALEDCR